MPITYLSSILSIFLIILRSVASTTLSGLGSRLMIRYKSFRSFNVKIGFFPEKVHLKRHKHVVSQFNREFYQIRGYFFSLQDWIWGTLTILLLFKKNTFSWGIRSHIVLLHSFSFLDEFQSRVIDEWPSNQFPLFFLLSLCVVQVFLN